MTVNWPVFGSASTSAGELDQHAVAFRDEVERKQRSARVFGRGAEGRFVRVRLREVERAFERVFQQRRDDLRRAENRRFGAGRSFRVAQFDLRGRARFAATGRRRRDREPGGQGHRRFLQVRPRRHVHAFFGRQLQVDVQPARRFRVRGFRFGWADGQFRVEVEVRATRQRRRGRGRRLPARVAQIGGSIRIQPTRFLPRIRAHRRRQRFARAGRRQRQKRLAGPFHGAAFVDACFLEALFGFLIGAQAAFFVVARIGRVAPQGQFEAVDRVFLGYVGDVRRQAVVAAGAQPAPNVQMIPTPAASKPSSAGTPAGGAML